MADPIGGGAANGECTGPSKGRRSEVRRDGWDCRKVRGDPQETQGHRADLSVEKDKASDRAAIGMFVLMAEIVVGGIFGNFLREAAVRILDALGAWWGS